jgi:hypothetical protein
MERERHIRLLAWLWVIRGLLLVLGAVIAVIACTFSGLFSHHFFHAMLSPIIGLTVGFALFLFALPSLAAGIGLLDGKSWSRVLAMILAAFAFFDFPLGTALCVYTFWTLWGREADDHFEGRHTTRYEYER